MSDVKPSGPLWALVSDDGEMYHWTTVDGDAPNGGVYALCRLIPGHGRVVPIALVEAIWNTHKQSTDFHIETDCAECEAIRAAIEGAL